VQVRPSEYSDAVVNIENIGGIDRTSVEFSPGVTLFVGRNATNRTSFFQSVIAALGSEDFTMKSDADNATVDLELGDEVYTRELSRRTGEVTTAGTPYLDDPELADLFAFLLESNEARRAVVGDDNLHELIMRPVDTDEIQTRIDGLVEERESLREELDRIAESKGELPALEEQRATLQDRIEERQAELEETEAEIEAVDADVEESREDRSKLEDKLEELRTKRSTLDEVRYDLETERESLETLRQERRELQTERDELPESPVGEVAALEDEIDELRQQKQRLEPELNELQSVISFNEEMLSDGESNAFDELLQDEKEVTEQLLVDDTVTCWTCGSEVEQEQIQTTLDQLRERSQSIVGDIRDIESQLDDRRSEKRDYEQAQRERERIERRFDSVGTKIEQTEQTIENLRDRREELRTAVEAVEAEVEELESEDFGAVLDLHKEANQLEYELGRLETDLERTETDIAAIEDRVAEQGDIEAQIEEVTGQIESLRTKIDRIEQDAIEQFNEHMDEVLDRLGYTNLKRIWIEKKKRQAREGRRVVTKTTFELHVIRESQSGTAYEDTVDHLSESEREVTGLVFALAGYLAHNVYETVPFMILDSLEAIDSERIAALVEYLTDYTGYLLVALLPEDAAQLPDEYERVTEI
jgi:DNA repair exonuclease SbcCD ATPase subunit